jgi:hypothetical protein
MLDRDIGEDLVPIGADRRGIPVSTTLGSQARGRPDWQALVNCYPKIMMQGTRSWGAAAQIGQPGIRGEARGRQNGCSAS